MTAARRPAAHCPTCYCDAGVGRIDRDAPFYPLVELVERAWMEVLTEDRLAGRAPWNRTTERRRRRRRPEEVLAS